MSTHHHFPFVCPDWCSEPLVRLELQILSGAIYLDHSVVLREGRKGREEVVKAWQENEKRDFSLAPVAANIDCGAADPRLLLRLCDLKAFVLDKEEQQPL